MGRFLPGGGMSERELLQGTPSTQKKPPEYEMEYYKPKKNANKIHQRTLMSKQKDKID